MSLRLATLSTTHCPFFFLAPVRSPPLYYQNSRRRHTSSPSPRLIIIASSQQQQEQQSQLPPSSGDDGPIELPPQSDDPFSFLNTTAPSSPLQSALSILFTGTLAVFLYRALRKRTKLVKQTKFRSSGLQSVEEGETPKNQGVLLTSDQTKKGPRPPPSAFQTLQGAIIAGAIAYVLYNFSTYVDAGFAAKPVSTVYTIRQLTITIRTIITGICYLATFVFAANSLGLGLYSIQIALNLTTTSARPATIENSTPTSDVDSLDSESAEKVNEDN